MFNAVKYNPFALDLRSLAAARILAGLLTLVDLFFRTFHLQEFYTQDGLLPRRLLLSLYPKLAFPSLHVANDTAPYVAFLFGVHAILGVALMVGYRTRLASILCWVFMMSLHARNPIVLNSGDSLFTIFLFWGMFLPWGRRWSMDAREADSAEPELIVNPATVGMVLQMSCLYLFAALHKLEPTWLEQGAATYYAMSIEHFARARAEILLHYPDLLKALTWTVLGYEMLAPLLLLVPLWPVRAFGVAGCLALHYGFGAFLELGLFRWTPMIGLLALIPARIWERAREGPTEVDLRPSLKNCLLLIIITLTLLHNVESLHGGRSEFIPEPVRRITPMVGSWQNWGVFVSPALQETGWFAIEIETNQGCFDIWNGSREFSADPPALISATYPTQRWRKWMMTMPAWMLNRDAAIHWLSWWMDRWDSQHPGNPSTGVNFWYFRKTNLLDYEDSLYEKRLLGRWER